MRTNIDLLTMQVEEEISKNNRLPAYNQMTADAEATAGEDLKYKLPAERDDIIDRRRFNFYAKKIGQPTPLSDDEWVHIKQVKTNVAVEASLQGLPDKK